MYRLGKFSSQNFERHHTDKGEGLRGKKYIEIDMSALGNNKPVPVPQKPAQPLNEGKILSTKPFRLG